MYIKDPTYAHELGQPSGPVHVNVPSMENAYALCTKGKVVWLAKKTVPGPPTCLWCVRYLEP